MYERVWRRRGLGMAYAPTDHQRTRAVLTNQTRTSYPRFWATVGRRPAPRRPGTVAARNPVGERPLRIAVVGKGGTGKSVIAGTMARLLARRGHRVLALDADQMPGLGLNLGSASPPTPPLVDAVEEAGSGCWRLRKGVGPVRAIQRFCTLAPDGVRVLEAGKQPIVHPRPVTPSIQAFYQVIHGLPEASALRAWTIIGDHPAGPRHLAQDWAPYADTMLVVVEATWQAGLTGRRLAALAAARGVPALPVASKVRGPADVRRVEEFMGNPLAARIPADEAVVDSDRRGVALIDHAPTCPAVRAIAELVESLVAGRLGAAGDQAPTPGAGASDRLAARRPGASARAGAS